MLTIIPMVIKNYLRLRIMDWPELPLHRETTKSATVGEASVTVLEAIGHRNAQEVRDWLDP